VGRGLIIDGGGDAKSMRGWGGGNGMRHGDVVSMKENREGKRCSTNIATQVGVGGGYPGERKERLETLVAGVKGQSGGALGRRPAPWLGEYFCVGTLGNRRRQWFDRLKTILFSFE